MSAPHSTRLALALALAAALPAARAAAPQAAGEYFFNVDPGAGAATPLPLSDPPPTLDALDSLALPLPSAPGSPVVIGLRFRTADGAWGPTHLRRVHLIKPASASAVESAWGDTFASASTATPDANGSVTLTRPASVGGDVVPDRLSLRVVSAGDTPGARHFRTVHPLSGSAPQRVYYAVDQRANPASSPFVELSAAHRLAPTPLTLDLGGAAPGYHTLHLLLRDASGGWTESLRFFHVTPAGPQTLSGLVYRFQNADGQSAAQVAPLVAGNAAQDVSLSVPSGITGDRTLVLRLGDLASTPGFGASASLTIGTLFDQWSAAALTGQSAESSGPLADPDGDQLVNLLEYAFGLDPLAVETSPPYTVESVPGTGAPLLVLRYRQRAGGNGARGVDYTAGGLRYTVEVSTDLATWVRCDQAPGVVAQSSATPPAGGIETVSMELQSAPGAPRFFARLAVSLAP